MLANVVLLVARATQGAGSAQEQCSRMLTALYRLLSHHTSRGTPPGTAQLPPQGMLVGEQGSRVLTALYRPLSRNTSSGTPHWADGGVEALMGRVQEAVTPR